MNTKYDDLVKRLREYAKEHCPLDRESGICGCIDAREAADVIEKMTQRIDRLMNCIYKAEDALDRGADNDWAREALEKAERIFNDADI